MKQVRNAGLTFMEKLGKATACVMVLGSSWLLSRDQIVGWRVIYTLSCEPEGLGLVLAVKNTTTAEGLDLLSRTGQGFPTSETERLISGEASPSAAARCWPLPQTVAHAAVRCVILGLPATYVPLQRKPYYPARSTTNGAGLLVTSRCPSPLSHTSSHAG